MAPNIFFLFSGGATSKKMSKMANRFCLVVDVAEYEFLGLKTLWLGMECAPNNFFYFLGVPLPKNCKKWSKSVKNGINRCFMWLNMGFKA